MSHEDTPIIDAIFAEARAAVGRRVARARALAIGVAGISYATLAAKAPPLLAAIAGTKSMLGHMASRAKQTAQTIAAAAAEPEPPDVFDDEDDDHDYDDRRGGSVL